jgi:hypothetical protein
MKTVVLLFLSSVLLFSFGCSNNDDEVDIDYPMDISFEEYSLNNTSCKWTNLDYDSQVTIINSNEELKNYISCTESSYSEIDFSTHTLLFAHGIASSSVVNANCSSLQQFSDHNYKMEVDIVLGDATVISNWQVPIIINKLSTGCSIGLIITIKYIEE